LIASGTSASPGQTTLPSSVALHTTWHGRPDWRLDAFEANRIAAELEAAGWRAEGINLAQGIALVEVRDLAVRWHPLVATLRTRPDAEAWRGAPSRPPVPCGMAAVRTSRRDSKRRREGTRP
jgi:hypothetical protein